MVHLAELLVVMTDLLKIVRIRARNVHCIHGQKSLDDDSPLCISLALQESDSVVFLKCCSVESQKNSSWDNAHVWQWPQSKKVVATVRPLHCDTKSE